MSEQQSTSTHQNQARAPKTEEIIISGMTMIKTRFGKKRRAGTHERTILIDKYGSVFTSTIDGDKEKSTITRSSVRWREDYVTAKKLLAAIFIPVTPDSHMFFFRDSKELYHSVVRNRKKIFPLAAVYADYGQLNNQNELTEHDRSTFASAAVTDLLALYPEETLASLLEEAYHSDYFLSKESIGRFEDVNYHLSAPPIVDVKERIVTLQYSDAGGRNYLVCKDLDTGLITSHVEDTNQVLSNQLN